MYLDLGEAKGGAGGAMRVLTKVVKGKKGDMDSRDVKKEKCPRHGRQIELDSWLPILSKR